MKKIFLSLFTVLLIFCGMSKTSAETKNPSQLLIKTETVSPKIVDEVKQKWQSYFKNISAVEQPTVSPDDYYLGHPFTIKSHTSKNSAYFPIISVQDKYIAYLLNVVITDNSPSFTISKQFADAINVLSTRQDPLSLSLNSSTHQLEASEDAKDSRKATDILQSLAQYHEISARSIPDDTIPSYSRNLIPNWKITETQSSQPWCMYYSLSTMINSSENKIVTNAKKLLKKQFPKATDQQLLDPKFISSTPIDNTFKSMKNAYGYTLDYKTETLNPTQVKEQIDKKAPIYVSLDNLTTNKDKSKSHGIVIIGYVIPDDKSKDAYYYYWNPWWPNIMMTSAKDMNKLPLGTDVYSWYAVGINFRKG